MLSLLGGLLGAGVASAEVVVSRDGRDFLIYPDGPQILGALCAPDQVIRNHAACADVSAPLAEVDVRSQLSATCHAAAEDAQRRLGGIYAAITGVDAQLTALLAVEPAPSPIPGLKEQIAALALRLGTAERLLADLADQVARIDASLATHPDPDLQAQEADLRAKQARATLDAATLLAQMTQLQQAAVDAGSGILDPATFRDLQATRASYVATATSLADRSAVAIQDCTNVGRLLAYVTDAHNPYDMSDGTAASGAYSDVRPIAQVLLVKLQGLLKDVTQARAETRTTGNSTLQWTEACGAQPQPVRTNLVSLACTIFVDQGTYCRDVEVRLDGAPPGLALTVGINQSGGDAGNPNLHFSVDAATGGASALLAANGCGNWQVISDFSCSPTPTSTGQITPPNGVQCQVVLADHVLERWP